ncbi:hypothetical protein HNY73_011618 [Argiope bruennichi]|uniref:Uncharacterized protein n=1 Tax=Argiope bruennichi TaxID=94029 RepID=A0A8T0EZ69_ARGBR|nr:hypothetical protein HNY73_011618 [Argiope bruennichi]
MERSFVERAPSPTEQELLLRVITPTKRTMPGAQTSRTGSYQNLSGKGEMSSSNDEENQMEMQQCQNSGDEEARTEEIKTVPRPISPSSIEVTEDFIAEHSLEITQAISLKENLGNWAQALAAAKDEGQHLQVKREIQQVSGCLNQLLIKLGIPLFKLPENVRKLNFICEKVRMKNAPSVATNAEAKNVKSNAKPNESAKSNLNIKTAPKRKINLSENKNKSVSSPKGGPVKESKKRVADEDGFIAPAAHLVRKIKNLKPNSIKNKEIEIKQVPEGIEEVALDEEVDADPSPAQPKQKRVPPFFVTPRADFRTMLNILKLEAPSLRSVMSNRFLKLTVETEEEHRSLSHLLESQGAEFKTFMLKQDRPIKVVIRGLPSCTPIEDIKSEFLTLYLPAVDNRLLFSALTNRPSIIDVLFSALPTGRRLFDGLAPQRCTDRSSINRLLTDLCDYVFHQFSMP